MTEHSLERTQIVPVPLEQAFAFFADARNLERITPPWLRFRIVEAPQELSVGALVWRLVVRGWVEGIFEYRAGEVPALLTQAPAAPPRRTV